MAPTSLPENLAQERAAAIEAANALLVAGRNAEVQEMLENGLRADPTHAFGWCYLSIALRQQNLFAAAVAAARRAVELAPDEPVILSNLGSALRLSDRPEALEPHAKAARLAPDNFDIRVNRAIALNDFVGPVDALNEFKAARALRPGDVNARFEHSAALLQLGNYRDGFPDYEARWQRPGARRANYPVPAWTGDDIKGKTIIAWSEQGNGDTIMASRYLPLLKARGARVIFGCPDHLHRLFEGAPGIDRIASAGPLGEQAHCHVPVMSLPGIFDATMDTIPPALPLRAAPKLKPEIARLLEAGGRRFRIGIAWSGSHAFPQNWRRAVTLERFLPLASLPGVQLYSLQRDAPDKELDACGADGLIKRVGPLLDDFADTAAVLQQLHLVIMTDSAIAHLAGTLGRPVWNLLNANPYWPYQRRREDCAWYPSMRLFRQPAPGDWDSVFRAVAEALPPVMAAAKVEKPAAV